MKSRGRPKIGAPVLPAGLSVEWHPGKDLLPRKVMQFGPIVLAVDLGKMPRPQRKRGKKSGLNSHAHRTIAHEVVRLERALTQPPYRMTGTEARNTAVWALAAATELNEKTIKNALTPVHMHEAEAEQAGYLAAIEVEHVKGDRAARGLAPLTREQEADAQGAAYLRISGS